MTELQLHSITLENVIILPFYYFVLTIHLHFTSQSMLSHTFVEIDHDIISMFILLPPLIRRLLSVTSVSICAESIG